MQSYENASARLNSMDVYLIVKLWMDSVIFDRMIGTLTTKYDK